MKIPSIVFQQCLLLLLLALFLVRGIDDTDASESKTMSLSTGETPMAFVRKMCVRKAISNRKPRILQPFEFKKTMVTSIRWWNYTSFSTFKKSGADL